MGERPEPTGEPADRLRDAALRPPLLTADLPGIGGRMRVRDEDFLVDEIPAYAPDGKLGGWVMLQLRKRGMSTEDAVRTLAKALGIGLGDVGYAGRKDREAISRQWISVPVLLRDRLLGLSLEGIELGPPHLHSHKLRTGHLHGNRFEIVIRELACDVDTAIDRCRAKLDRLAAQGGLPNAFGPQRFGDGGNGVERGIAAIQGGRGGARGNMTVAAGQSVLFNLYLRLRAERGLLRRALVGDILKKTDTGGLFVCSDAGADDERLAAGILVVTGPIYGSRTMSPPDDSPSHALEQEVLALAGIDDRALRSLGRAALGTRRPLQVAVGDAALQAAPALDASSAAALRIAFSLPAGCFATALCRELQSGPGGHDVAGTPAQAS